MSHIAAPYRFVPLADGVLFPEWANQVSHDKPFADGICGELELTIIADEAICVGSKQIASTDTTPGEVKFFRTPDNQFAIPASSIKGMLRNVVEIATFSKFNQVEDQKLGVRDISQSKNFYTTEITQKPVKAGWLNFENGEWVIYSSSFSRVHQKDILKYFGIDYSKWAVDSLKTAPKRYAFLQNAPKADKNAIYQEVIFTAELQKNKTVATLGVGSTGYLVVTGQPGQFYNQHTPNEPRPAKKYEFVFTPKKGNALKIAADAMNGFRQIHDDTDEWKFWQNNQGKLSQGIPVFYHEEGGKVTSLGLAMMYKLAYKKSIHDAIANSSKDHLDNPKADFAQLLFGFLGENDNDGLKGRINFGLASLVNNQNSKLSKPLILNSPKPTFYPFYIRQNESGEFNQLMLPTAKLAGWKRYHAKKITEWTLGEKSGTKVQVQLETLPNGSQFSGKIRFHNLRPMELGALLWAIDFGGRTELRHGLGMGKPYGFGKVELRIKPVKTRLNTHKEIDSVTLLDNARTAFIEYMNSRLGEWEKTSELESLLQFAQVVSNSKGELDYMSKPLDFAKLKKKEYLREFHDVFHAGQPVNFNKLNAEIEKLQALEAKRQADEQAKANLMNQIKDLSEKQQLIYLFEQGLPDESQWKNQPSKTVNVSVENQNYDFVSLFKTVETWDNKADVEYAIAMFNRKIPVLTGQRRLNDSKSWKERIKPLKAKFNIS